MPQATKRRGLLVAVLILVAVTAGMGGLKLRDAFDGLASFDLRAQRIVGNELRLVLETSVTTSSPMRSSLQTGNANGWLVVVDLLSEKPFAERSRVVGPLWEIADERSSLSFESGANFTKEDAAAAAATPFVDFDADGTVVRIRYHADRKEMVRERLQLEGKTAKWNLEGPYTPIPHRSRPMSEASVVTLSGTHQLLFAAGKTTLYERLTGKPVPDPWLEAAFTSYRNHATLKNVSTYLTDDRKYLVCTPRERYFDNDSKVTHETFELGGKAYSRAEHLIVRKRPLPDPIVVKRDVPQSDTSLDSLRYAVSIDGNLYFCYELDVWDKELQQTAASEKVRLKLVPLDKLPVYEAHPPAGRVEFTESVYPNRMQPLEKSRKIALFATNHFGRDAPGREPDEAVTIFFWDYAKGTLTAVDAPTKALFVNSRGEYVPKNGIKPQ